jgi:hypothetical protein
VGKKKRGKKWQEAGLVMEDMKTTYFIEEKLNHISTQLEASPQKI